MSPPPPHPPPADVDHKLFSMAVVFGCSLFAAGLPLASRRFMDSRHARAVFFVGKHFGTGVILATAFAHLLQDAFMNLGRAGPRWRHIAGLVTLGSLLTIFLVEYSCTAYVEHIVASRRRLSTLSDATPRVSREYRDDPLAEEELLGHSHPSLPAPPPAQDDYFAAQTPSIRRRRASHYERSETKSFGADFLDRRTQIISILVIQLGIMLHSLVIGITLAFTHGPDFTSLITAIIFHQLFEGISLGVRISELPTNSSNSRRHRLFPLVLVVLFALTVPLGIVLGLFALPQRQRELAGLLQAASAGMLIYAGTVEMLAEDFVHASEERLKGAEGVKAIVALISGAACMGALGIWV
ncbi:Zinc/iron permease [Auricularia subglabra TFB-10046 SS5]|nr:Zinc/iron permease [Auricularia subglabra TFB-10046 SS5]